MNWSVTCSIADIMIITNGTVDVIDNWSIDGRIAWMVSVLNARCCSYRDRDRLLLLLLLLLGGRRS